MFCMHCGKELESEAKFCAYCGHVVNKGTPQVPMQPVYYVPVAPVTQQAEPAKKGKLNALGIAGFSTAVVAALVVYIFESSLCFLLALPAFGLSLAGVIMRKKYRRVWGLALAGLIISSVILSGLVLACLIIFVIFGSLVLGI